jgi:glutamine phosphoribosylpyrophosphate amidotransferase
VRDGGIVIRKKPGSLVNAELSAPGDVKSLMAHCRLSLQGDQDFNDNNHPFYGVTRDSTSYALAHNGVLSGLRDMRARYSIPDSPIETDSYGAVQLLNRSESLDLESLRSVCEDLSGSFLFTILDERNNLYLCRGDVPVFLIHFSELELYLYVSTRDLFEQAIRGTILDDLYVTSNIEIGMSPASLVPVGKGEIVKISSEGNVERCCFNFNEEGAIKHNWYMHQIVGNHELEMQIKNLNNY